MKVLLATFLVGGPIVACLTLQPSFARLAGSSSDDYGYGIVVDSSGNTYITGSTSGVIGSNVAANAGGLDAFLIKWDSTGKAVFKRQSGSTSDDAGYQVIIDSKGTAWMAGYYQSSLAYVMNHQTDGVPLKTLTYGSSSTTGGNTIATGLATDSTNFIYISGSTNVGFNGQTCTILSTGSYCPFLLKIDPTTYNTVFTVIAGTINTLSTLSLAVNSDIYAFVPMNGGLVVFDRINGKYTKTMATYSTVTFQGVAVDKSNNVYLAGYSSSSVDGVTPTGSSDIVVIKYDSKGNRKFTYLYGSTGTEQVSSIQVDSTNNILYLVGYTSGNWFHTNAGQDDIVYFATDLNGKLLFGNQTGTAGKDHGNSIVVNSDGTYVYFSGYTAGKLYGQTYSGGNADAAMMKISTGIVPPSTVLPRAWDGKTDVTGAIVGTILAVGFLVLIGYVLINLRLPKKSRAYSTARPLDDVDDEEGHEMI